MKKGKWIKGTLVGFELAGKILGIVGIGRIGKSVADKALCLGMKVISYDIISLDQDYRDRGVIEMGSLEELFSTADIVTLHVPLIAETRHMVGWKVLSLMKPSAYLINCSRGEVVDTEALTKALEKDLIAGAALDVFETEPPGDLRLLKFDNVVATPHIAAQSVEAQRSASIMTAKRLLELL